MIRRIPSDSLPLFDGEPLGPPTYRFERELTCDGHQVIAGADEAGRGPLAGPVVASAVILDPDNIPAGLNDSKQLTAAQRELLYVEILASSEVAIASVSAREIDRTDIRKASLEAMRRAIASLGRKVDFALIDGRDIPPGLGCLAWALVKGDARSLSISAASIIAKVTRDRMMAEAGLIYPAYAFEQHAGYATSLHRQRIDEEGPCPLHRMSFSPLRRD